MGDSPIKYKKGKEKKKLYHALVHNTWTELLYNSEILKWKFITFYNDYSNIAWMYEKFPREIFEKNSGHDMTLWTFYFYAFQNYWFLTCSAFLHFYIVLTLPHPVLAPLHFIRARGEETAGYGRVSWWCWQAPWYTKKPGKNGSCCKLQLFLTGGLWEYAGHITRNLYNISYSSNITSTWAQFLFLTQNCDKDPFPPTTSQSHPEAGMLPEMFTKEP